MAEVLALKIGLVENVTFADGTTLESAIRKQSVDVHDLVAESNDVGLKAYNSGMSKTLGAVLD